MVTPLKLLMVNREISQTDFAKSIGISNTSMSSLVRGKTVPHLVVAMKIARELDTTVEELWGHLLEDGN